MNRILAQYLTHAATAAEVAPFGTPGIFQVNYFFNNSLVWAASSVARARIALDAEPTESNHERYERATVRLNTVASFYQTYASEVACPKLELPHVQRFLGLDKEPDTTQLTEQAQKAAKSAVQSACIMGRNPAGVYAKTYASKLVEMERVRNERAAMLDEVYSLVHTEPSEHLYDEAEVETFIDGMESMLMSVARANWLHTRAQLTDSSMQMFRVEKYQRVKASNLGCATFLHDQGISDETLVKWADSLSAFADKEALAHSSTVANAEAVAAQHEQEFLAQQAAQQAVESVAHKVLRRVRTPASIAREQEATAAALARKTEDEAIAATKLAAKMARLQKKYARTTA